MTLQSSCGRSLSYLALFAALSGAGCSDTDAAQQRTSASAKGNVMTEAKCADDQVSRSICMIRIILDDVQKRNGGIDGGGISEIKAISSTVFTVSLPREERIEQLTYEFAPAAGTVALKKRTENAQGL
jgi:hypothetical protein